MDEPGQFLQDDDMDQFLQDCDDCDAAIEHQAQLERMQEQQLWQLEARLNEAFRDFGVEKIESLYFRTLGEFRRKLK